ncbi:NAD(P)H-dependent oxidoreductase [Pelomonas sp. CA6]|uniref:NADPH-dependent FMN reductase n=1 Tax=Pelomonas sp. CA6 TaxID=2907999 RepID=UPI001F4C48AB|nr:NAD(P)H-dependent oxidoreductase [Pelomonas sp. CA6]MCH7343540.1 NAD(P)H-dependent oxidoreductase [Pelomonas sp. CA6]
MSTQVHQVAVLVGSLRKGSLSRRLALALQRLAPPSLKLEIVEIGQLPFYNADEEPSPPASYGPFRDAIRAADALLLVSPEYNRSVPAALKNALDVGSRPYGHNVFNAKPAAVITQSPGAIGGFGANHHLRQILACLNVSTMPGPEVYLGGSQELLDEAGAITKPDTEAFLRKFVEAFAAWVARQRG